MKLDALRIELRPRTAYESADLGVRLVQAHAREVWRIHFPLLLVVAAFAGLGFFVNSWLPSLLLFWCKPWLDRSLLFVLSRAVFGERTRFSDLWQARGRWWFSRLWAAVTIDRLSPWRSFVLPLTMLEGQRGVALRTRARLLLRGQRPAAALVTSAFATIEQSLVFGVMGLVFWLLPVPERSQALEWFAQQAPSMDAYLPVGGLVLYALVILAVEPCFVAAGFAMYLGRRVQLEAWDVEQEFRHVFS